MDIIWGGEANPEVNRALGEWCAAQIGGRILVGPFSTMGVFNGRELQAVVVYHNYYPDEGTVELSGAAVNRRWLTRPVLWAMYDFAFNKLGCQTVVQRNDPDDRHLTRMLTAYGFSNHRIPRLKGRNKDELIFVLHDDVWRENGFHKENADG